MWNNLIQRCATSLTLFYSVIETDVVLVTILIVVDNYKSYRDLLFGHPMFCIAFTLNLLYGSIMRVALCRVQHLITAAILYFMWLQQKKYWLK